MWNEINSIMKLYVYAIVIKDITFEIYISNLNLK
jgi:hypothetical protein